MECSFSELKNFVNKNNLRHFIYNSSNNNNDGVEFALEFSNISVFPNHKSVGFSNPNADVVCFKDISNINLIKTDNATYINLHSGSNDYKILTR